MDGWMGYEIDFWSYRVSNPENQKQISRVLNLSTNIRVWELQGAESRHATGYQI